MTILTIRTDKPEAEIGLFNNKTELAYAVWQAHRQLAETLHKKIDELLQKQKLRWSDIDGMVIYQGPGSFTGLRIGLSVANALAYSLPAPIIGATREKWSQHGITELLKGKNNRIVMPEYGSPVHTTLPAN